MYQPLADLLRPTTLDQVYGQEHILGEGAILRRLIQSKVEGPLAEELLRTGKKPAVVEGNVQDGRVIFQILGN